MEPGQTLPCIICGKKLEPSMPESVNQPYGGTVFTSGGHYGSTVWDPIFSGEFLELNFCDACLKDRKEWIIVGRSTKPVLGVVGYDEELEMPPSQYAWATKVKEPYHPWDPEADREEDHIRIDSWEEWVEQRDELGLESRFSDLELQEMFRVPPVVGTRVRISDQQSAHYGEVGTTVSIASLSATAKGWEIAVEFDTAREAMEHGAFFLPAGFMRDEVEEI